MDKNLKLHNNVRAERIDKSISQAELASMVGTTRQTIIAVEKGTFCPSAKLAMLICIALDKKFENLFYF